MSYIQATGFPLGSIKIIQTIEPLREKLCSVHIDCSITMSLVGFPQMAIKTDVHLSYPLREE